MPELETREQALAYLAEMSPTETFRVYPFEHGWVCTKVPTPQQVSSGATVGMARLVIDSQTGNVYVYPSLPVPMVAEMHSEGKRTGRNKAGEPIYPHRWRITMDKTLEDDATVEYQMTVESLTDPPEPNQRFPMTINKQTFHVQPPGRLTRRAMARAESLSRQNQGVWPETAETTV
ncbi:hypothetical protein EB75_19660 [Mycobacterium sp. ST-F2]|nr:hypothetical protein EB75_19660 [Mycobacterium sp. ST-F2]